jgi:hypothetical protein
MHRAILLAVASFLSLLPINAKSQWAVVDAAQIMANEIHQVQTLAEWAKSASDMARQIEGDYMRYMQLVYSYQAITRVTDLGSAVAALNMLGIKNPLPINPYAAQALMSGRGGAGGMLGSLSGLYSGALATNRVYETQGSTWLERQINEQGLGLAGSQAMSMQLYQSAAERAPLLQELQARIDTARDPSERESLIARFAAEQSYILNQQVQAHSVSTYMQSQIYLRDQQREEHLQQSIDEVLADARARGYMP